MYFFIQQLLTYLTENRELCLTIQLYGTGRHDDFVSIPSVYVWSLGQTGGLPPSTYLLSHTKTTGTQTQTPMQTRMICTTCI